MPDLLKQPDATFAHLPYDTDPDMRFTAHMSRDPRTDEPTWTLTDSQHGFPDYQHTTLEACDHVVGYWLTLLDTGFRITSAGPARP